MGERSIFGKHEVRFLRELVKQKVDFMIVGVSAAALQGAPVVTMDIDLWFDDLSDPRLMKALKKVKCFYVPQIGKHPPTLGGDAAKFFDIVVHMDGLGDFTQEKTNVVVVSLEDARIPVLLLERVIKSKKAAGRKKDKLILPELIAALKTITDHQADR